MRVQKRKIMSVREVDRLTELNIVLKSLWRTKATRSYRNRTDKTDLRCSVTCKIK